MPHLLPHPALLPVWLLLSPVWAGYRLYRFAVHGDVGEDLSLSSASVLDDRLETGVVVASPPPPPVASPTVVEIDTPRIVPLLPVADPIASSSLPDKAANDDDDDHVDIQLDEEDVVDNRPQTTNTLQST